MLLQMKQQLFLYYPYLHKFKMCQKVSKCFQYLILFTIIIVVLFFTFCNLLHVFWYFYTSTAHDLQNCPLQYGRHQCPLFLAVG